MRMMTGLPLVRSLADIITLDMRGLTKSARGLKTAANRGDYVAVSSAIGARAARPLLRRWIYVTSGAGCDFGRMAASAAFLISSNRPPLLIKHWQMLNGVAENFQFSRRQNLTCRHHAQVAEEPNAEFVTWRVFLRPLSPIRSLRCRPAKEDGGRITCSSKRELSTMDELYLSKKCRYARSKKNDEAFRAASEGVSLILFQKGHPSASRYCFLRDPESSEPFLICSHFL